MWPARQLQCLPPTPLCHAPVLSVLDWPPACDDLNCRCSIVLELQGKRKLLPQQRKWKILPALNIPVFVSQNGESVVVWSASLAWVGLLTSGGQWGYRGGTIVVRKEAVAIVNELLGGAAVNLLAGVVKWLSVTAHRECWLRGYKQQQRDKKIVWTRIKGWERRLWTSDGRPNSRRAIALLLPGIMSANLLSCSNSNSIIVHCLCCRHWDMRLGSAKIAVCKKGC
jgi:hypothetical protein